MRRASPQGRPQRSVRLSATAALIALAGVAGLPPSPALARPASQAGAAPTRITVSQERYVTTDGRPVGEVPAAIVGANQRWPDDGKGIWNSAAWRPADGIVRLSKQAGLDMLRYPGGTVANLFDFKRAIGPQDQRKCQTSGGFANGRFASTDSRFGPDENEKYVRSIGGETMMMVSAINQSAAGAADFVEYMNAPADGRATNPNGGVDWGDVRARNGHSKPYGIHYWEFGNEPYLVGQHYWWSGEAAARLQQFIEGGWQRQTAKDAAYQANDGLFLGCDLATRRQGTGAPNQEYRVRFAPIALPGDDEGAAGVGDGPITEPVLRVAGSPWQRVASLAGQAPDAHVYTVGKLDGSVHFGDGTHGAVPPAGAALSIEYTSGVHQGYVAFRKAMKAVDPSIEVCSGWGRPEFVEAMGSRPYDCLGTHSYSTPPADGTLTRYGNLQVAAAKRDADLRDLRDRMARYFPDTATRPDLLVTEYGTLNTPAPAYEARLAHVLYLAAQVAGQMENDVRVSINSNTADLPSDDGSPDPANLFGSPPGFLMTGRADMLGLYATMAGGHVVKSAVTGNPVLTAPAGTYPALRVVSACTSGVIRTMVVNRDAEHAVPADIALPGGGVTGPVSVSTVNGASVESYNAPDHPQDISVRTSQEKAGRGVLSHEFEPHSVTLLRFTGHGRTCGS